MPLDPNAVRCADCGANPIGPDGRPDLRHSMKPGMCRAGQLEEWERLRDRMNLSDPALHIAAREAFPTLLDEVDRLTAALSFVAGIVNDAGDVPVPTEALVLGASVGLILGQRNEVRAKVEQLREVLREVEWSSSAMHSNTYGGYCPVCHGNRPNHSPQCRLAAALKE